MKSKTCKLGLSHVSLSKVNKLLKNLKNTRSTAVDELDNYCVKISADIITRPLHHIISLSILQQKFPESWKYSKLIPLHKKGSKLERKNYRPVAILSPLSKILDKLGLSSAKLRVWVEIELRFYWIELVRKRILLIKLTNFGFDSTKIWVETAEIAVDLK